MTFETRMVTTEFELRDDSAAGPVLEGYAATFGQPYDMGPFDERLNPVCFNRTLKSTPPPDVRLLIDHEGQPLGRTRSGTLQLSTDTHGFHWRSQLEPSDPDVQRIIPKVRRGDLGECSFAFRVPSGGDSWDYSGERAMRTLNEVSLHGGDVSIVTYPANPNTSVQMRKQDEHAARCLFVENAVREIRAGRALSQANIDKLMSVLQQIAAADEAVDQAQVDLASVLGVPNPDTDDAGEPDADDAPPQRSLSADTAKRLAALRDLR